MENKKLVSGVLAILFFIIYASINSASVQAATADYRLLFDADFYYQTYSDVAAVCGRDDSALYAHFTSYGIYEGRCGSVEFDVNAYRSRYTDLNESFGDYLISYYNHYLSYGRAEGRIATTDGEPYTGRRSTVLTDTISKKAKAAQKGEYKEANGPPETVAAGQAPDSNGSSKTTITTAAKSSPQETVVSGTYTTYYNEAEVRAVNVELAAQRINGVVVQPGESFSFSQTVLPRTAENGYVVAPVILNGKMSEGIGGGICQVSSTLYAAMLTAGVPATDRHAHSLAVGYVPKGMDATIAGNQKDLKFKNIYERPLEITAIARGGKLVITIGMQE